jgi:RNA polymerase-binding transcription factor DksA
MPDDGDLAANLDQIGADLEGVEEALARLDAGTYEQCEVCGQPISGEALAADPVRRRCAAHGAT